MIFDRSIPSALSELDALTAAVQDFLTTAIPDDDLAFRVALVTSEAVMNAVEHGNALDASRTAHVRIDATTSHVVEVSVTDEGAGFDPNGVPSPLSTDGLLADGGRGVFLMRELSDEVEFRDGGRTVVLTLRPRA